MYVLVPSLACRQQPAFKSISDLLAKVDLHVFVVSSFLLQS